MYLCVREGQLTKTYDWFRYGMSWFLTFSSISVSRYETSREGCTAPIALIFVSNLGNGCRIPNIKGILMIPRHVGAVLSHVWSNR